MTNVANIIKKTLLIILLLPLFAKAQISVVKSNLNGINTFMQYDNQLFFYANDGVNIGLWKTDGTTSGTVFVKYITGIQIALGREPLVSGGLLYFHNSDGELWRTDGTATGTFSINPVNVAIYNKIDLNGILIFTAPPCPTSLTLQSTTDDYSSGILVKQASATNGTIKAEYKEFCVVKYSTFILETTSLVPFGASWLVKGSFFWNRSNFLILRKLGEYFRGKN